MRPIAMEGFVEEAPLRFLAPGGERMHIDVLDDDLVRVRILPDGLARLDRTWIVGDCGPEGRPRDDLSDFPCPAPDVHRADGRVSITTARLRLEVVPSDGTVAWFDGEAEFAADVASRRDRSGRAIWHFMKLREEEHFYGFGERAGPLDKAGMRMRMQNLDALGYDAVRGDPLYKHFPLFIAFDGVRAYAMLYDNLSTSVFDMGCERDAYHGRYRYFKADDGDLDYYMIFGPSIKQVVERIGDLTGRMPRPPRWSLGYLGSTMAYTEAPDAQRQLARFVDLCREHRIPCDLFHLSSGYTLDAEGRRNVFTWNRERIPEPAEMIGRFSAAGMQIAANVKPCILTTHPEYDELREYFVQQAECDEPEISTFWGGGGSYLDFTSRETCAWWRKKIRDELLAYGVAATWNDNNEYEVWDDDARCKAFRIGMGRPIQTLLMLRASQEAQREARPDERPWLISRSGCPGMQRYAQTWSGDNRTSWETLRYNIPMGLGLSLSGVASCGHDVGGFAGQAPSAELFVRWVQNGIFHPRFTIHSWHDDGTVNEPWMYPEVIDIVRSAIAFRYRLIPYFYALFVAASEHGTPIIRPTVYEFSHDPSTCSESFDFLLGPFLLVASVLDDGARTRSIYLPAGAAWCDFASGTWYEGGQRITLDAPLERCPLLVREGGMVPFGRSMRHVGASPDDVREVWIYPRIGASEFTLIEDDGRTLGYTRGEETRVMVEMRADEHEIEVRATRTGPYPLPYPALTIVLPQGEARELRGATAEHIDDDGRRRATLTI